MYQNIPNIEIEKCKQTEMFLFMCLGTILAFRKYFVPVNKPGTKYFLNAKILPKHINKTLLFVYIFLFQYLECFGTHFVTISTRKAQLMKGYVYLLKVTIYSRKMCTKMKKYGKIKV